MNDVVGWIILPVDLWIFLIDLGYLERRIKMETTLMALRGRGVISVRAGFEAQSFI